MPATSRFSLQSPQIREQGLTEKEISDISVSRWADSSKEKIILHGIAGLIQAKVGGTNALAGAGIAVVTARGVAVRDFLAAKGLPSDRLFLGAAKAIAASEKDKWQPRAELSLASQ